MFDELPRKIGLNLQRVGSKFLLFFQISFFVILLNIISTLLV
ncbi:hypothetical protein QH294_1909 [Enterococcus faecalis]|nr:hypothetical protein QH294_1909 [Enterococcus faecalis]